jgi:hypothetical protein
MIGCLTRMAREVTRTYLILPLLNITVQNAGPLLGSTK